MNSLRHRCEARLCSGYGVTSLTVLLALGPARLKASETLCVPAKTLRNSASSVRACAVERSILRELTTAAGPQADVVFVLLHFHKRPIVLMVVILGMH
jgi:hypothetical protein